MGRETKTEKREKNEIESLEELDVMVHEPGQRAKAVVTMIRKGKLGVLIDMERIRDPRIRERMEAQRERDAVQICFELDGRQWCQVFVVSSSPRSNMYRLVKKYGKLRIGSEIEVVFNAAGFPRIALD